MRLFGGDQVARLMTIFKLPENVPLEHSMVSRAIEQAQVKVEGFHFDSRKHLVEYDDILNKQREIIYSRRRKILEGESQKETILGMLGEELDNVVAMYSDERSANFDRQKILNEFISIIPFDELSQQQLLGQLEQFHARTELSEFLVKLICDMYENRQKQVTPEIMRQIERWVSLGVIDNFWMDHLDAIDDLREGIGLRGYGQRDPLVEYKNEAFTMFEHLMATINTEIVHRIFKVQVQIAPQTPNPTNNINLGSPESKIAKAAKSAKTNEPVSITSVAQPAVSHKIGRNDPCWCGSGKKWKKCHYPALG